MKMISHSGLLVLLIGLAAGCGAPSKPSQEASPGTTPAPTETPAPVMPTFTTEPTTAPRAIPPFSGSGGGVISFISNRTGNHDVFLMNADGSEQWQLSTTPDQDGWVTWSPHGDHMAYQSDRTGALNIFVMDIVSGSWADEAGVRQLTHSAPGSGSWEPAWSPDGIDLAYSAAQAAGSDIFVVQPDATGRERLTNNKAIDGSPSWSPDSKQLAFFSDRNGDWDIYIMNADGSQVRQLTANPASDSTPAWSPAGDWIAFVSDRDGNEEIYLVRPDGTDLRRLTNNAAEDWFPAWSPDARRIAFSSNRDGDDEIYIMNADGSEPRQLTNNAAGDWSPAWWPMGE